MIFKGFRRFSMPICRLNPQTDTKRCLKFLNNHGM
nr:MAG TPA: hypothetical protein [Caudoviricetes sp.]